MRSPVTVVAGVNVMRHFGEIISCLFYAKLRRLWNVIRSAGVIIVKRFENATALIIKALYKNYNYYYYY
jgi:hypothetical protein